MHDTIYAVATASGRAALAIIRVSGPKSLEVGQLLTGKTLQPRIATKCNLRAPGTQLVLDVAVATFFPEPNSYTGEDTIELSIHGGQAVVRDVLQALNDLTLRLAEPGEFTRRAFQFGKLDLAEAEAVADLIDAETSVQRAQAINQLNGGLSQQQSQWRCALIECCASLEASLDFPDEDTPKGVLNAVTYTLSQLEQDFTAAIDNYSGQQVREGYRIAILGPPNAGKSSLFNALVGRDAAIVTPIAGTTRDVVEAELILDGYKAIIADTAGLRKSSDTIEQEGVRRAERWAKDAALRVFVVDQHGAGMDIFTVFSAVRPGDILVLNKVDLPIDADGEEGLRWAAIQGVAVARCEAGRLYVGELATLLTHRLEEALGGLSHGFVTRTRHRIALSAAVDHVVRARQATSVDRMIEDIRLSMRALASLVGRVGSEAVLDEVFQRFCIGK